LVIADDELVGVFPAARLLTERATVCSHPGSTYGGLVGTEWLTGAKSLISFEALARYYAGKGFTHLLYKAVPHIYHRRPAQDDLYSLQRIGARRCRADLAAVIDLANRGAASSRRSRGFKKAQTSGITVSVGAQYLPLFWPVLKENLYKRHGVRPVHTEDELALLMDRFPESISLHVAMQADEVVAGIVVFDSERVRHSQYIGAAEVGRELGGLDAVFERCIREALERGFRFFSFGVSTESEGEVLNDGLHTFKAEFGASGIVHEFYELPL